MSESLKYITFLALLLFISCKDYHKVEDHHKTEIDSEYVIDESVIAMWNDYIESNPDLQNEKIPESDFFHNNRKDANRLAELTLNGKKRAASGLYHLYIEYNADLPIVGTKQIVTDFDGKAKAIIKNTSVDTIPFHKISKAYAALDMGTDTKSLEKWRKAHWKFFKKLLDNSNQEASEEMLIVCVEFEMVWPK